MRLVNIKLIVKSTAMQVTFHPIKQPSYLFDTLLVTIWKGVFAANSHKNKNKNVKCVPWKNEQKLKPTTKLSFSLSFKYFYNTSSNPLLYQLHA